MTVFGDYQDWLTAPSIPPTLLASLAPQVGQVQFQAQVTPASNATGLLLVPVLNGAPLPAHIASVNVQGGNSNASYYTSIAGPGNLVPATVPVVGTADAPYTITVNLTAAAGNAAVVLLVYELFGNMPPVGVAAALPSTVLTTRSFNTTLANTAVTPLVAANAGFTVTVYAIDICLGLSAVPAAVPTNWLAFVQDTNGLNAFAAPFLTVLTAAGEASVAVNKSFTPGFPLPQGVGVQVTCITGSATPARVTGTLQYTVT